MARQREFELRFLDPSDAERWGAPLFAGLPRNHQVRLMAQVLAELGELVTVAGPGRVLQTSYVGGEKWLCVDVSTNSAEPQVRTINDVFSYGPPLANQRALWWARTKQEELTGNLRRAEPKEKPLLQLQLKHRFAVLSPFVDALFLCEAPSETLERILRTVERDSLLVGIDGEMSLSKAIDNVERLLVPVLRNNRKRAG